MMNNRKNIFNIVLIAVFLLVFGACNFEAERNNPSDPKSDKYDPFSGQDLVVSPADYNFGDIDVEMTSGPVQFEIRNKTDETIRITMIKSLDPGLFQLIGIDDPFNDFDLFENDNFFFEVTFRPSTEGFVERTLEIIYNSDDMTHTFVVKVSGTGVSGGSIFSQGWNDPHRADNSHPDQQYWAESGMPQVGMSSDGMAIVTWKQKYTGAANHIFRICAVRAHVEDGTVEGVLKIDNAGLTDTGKNLDWPVLSVNNIGEAVTAWVMKENNDYYIQTRSYRDQGWNEGNWDSRGNVVSSSSEIYNLRIEMGSVYERAVVAWQQANLNDGYYAAFYNGQWHVSNQSFTSSMAPERMRPTIAITDHTAYIMAATGMHLYLYYIDMGSTTASSWIGSSEMIFNGDAWYNSAEHSYPEATDFVLDLYDGGGQTHNGIAVWGDSSPHQRIFANSNIDHLGTSIGQQWEATNDVLDLIGNDDSFKEARVVTNKYGGGDKAMIIYRDSAGSIDSQYKPTDTGGWDDSMWPDNYRHVLRNSLNDLKAFDIAMDGAGNCIVIWLSDEESSGNYRVYARRYDQSSNQWENKEMISGSQTVDNWNLESHHPRIAMDNTGNAVVAWISDDKIWTCVYKRNN